jgi:protein-S-isoprenylcysteine O-methyltransferase Ste14
MISGVVGSFGKIIASAFSFVLYVVSRFVKVIALIVIGAIAILILALIVSGHFSLPYITMITPDPVISGYLGFYAGMIALLILPLVFIIRTALRVIWGYRITSRSRTALTGIWALSMITFVLTVAFTARNFVYETSNLETLSHTTIDPGEPLLIKINKPDHSMSKGMHFGLTYLRDGHLYNRNGIRVRFRPAKEDQVIITKESRARGMNQETALRNSTFASHQIAIDHNALTVDDYYHLDNHSKYRGQSYYYTVFIPEGTKIKIDDASNIFDNPDLHNNQKATEKIWVMSEQGLIATELI